MLLPMLPAGMKQGHCCACDRIQSRRGHRFAEVAGGTGQAQILQLIAPVGSDMLHVHCLANGIPTGLTVLAAIMRPFVDQAHDGSP
jgi:hypothetical protein